MSVGKLIDFFSTFHVLPVEIETVKDQIVEEYKIADDIIFVSVDIDPSILLGMHYRFFGRDPNGIVVSKILIAYCSRLPIEWQRVVCCKELIHIMDRSFLRTSTEEAIASLAVALMLPLSAMAHGVSDIAAGKDRLAIYQAIAILVPEEMREDLMGELASKARSLENIAEMLVLPKELVEIALSSEWSKIWQFLKHI